MTGKTGRTGGAKQVWVLWPELQEQAIRHRHNPFQQKGGQKESPMGQPYQGCPRHRGDPGLPSCSFGKGCRESQKETGRDEEKGKKKRKKRQKRPLLPPM